MCGVFGICGRLDAPGPGRPLPAAHLAYLGLFALQHRGQESAGIAVSTWNPPAVAASENASDRGRSRVAPSRRDVTVGGGILLRKDMGLVADVFDRETLNELAGSAAIGHVRYSTTGSSRRENAQPLLGITSYGPVAVAHNGNFVNTASLRRRLLSQGAIFQTTTDTELLLALVSQSAAERLPEAVAQALQAVRGAYALVVLGEEAGGQPVLIGCRDPYGLRPLVLGRREDAYVLASETTALAAVGAARVTELEPGQAAIVTPAGLRIENWFPPRRRAFCVFEYIYLARPDAEVEGQSVHRVRQAIGRQLAVEAPVEADVVIPAPDSGTSAALGYAQGSGIPFDLGLVKNRYVGRTFIQPDQADRELGVRIKLNPVSAVLAGKRVVVVDDSIVRGTTSRKTVALLREAGAREVHLVIASPPYRHPCFYGVDTTDEEKLIARQHSVEEIKELVGADSLHFLSLSGLIKAVRGAVAEAATEAAAKAVAQAAGAAGPVGTSGGAGPAGALEAEAGELEDAGLCTACFSGRYPTELSDDARPVKDELEREWQHARTGGKA